MIVTSTPLLRLSQGQLNLLATCPRKFQHSYLEQLSSPVNPEQEAHLTLGSRFHLLMQQREIGLPIDEILQADPQLQTWMSAFTNAAPEILTNDNDQIFRESEHYRTFQIKDYLITVIYDLLIADSQQAQILDWKTYAQKPPKSSLAKNWQTRLYMYVLAETSKYLPENISMTYWFVQVEGKPQSVQFIYDIKQHQKTAQDLNKLLDNLTEWLEKYQQGQEFPQTPEYRNACEYCQYNVRCDRLQINQSEIITHSLPKLENIQEVSL
ncbi:MAG TPA: PD-(D/E)XK nuclease family protein [Nostocaceae cyanobacterium]|nr:PD-(D/E)XK nuclease family protein [Nostocaceae cyanobacterium]